MTDHKIDNCDGMSRAVETSCGPSGLVPWYLMASLMYYHFDTPILTDARFDEIGKTLLANWSEIEHPHKHFITEGDLQAGTCLLALKNFPIRTRAAAETAIQGTSLHYGPEQHARMYSDGFEPPDRLKDNAELYPYGPQGRSWASMQPSEAPKAPIRVRVRPVAPMTPQIAQNPPSPAVRVRTRPVAPS